MAHKIFNKFKAPKYTEFSRKDLVVDIKSGELYFKSNLGVHKVSTNLDSNTFGGDDVGIQTSSFDNLSVPGFIIGGAITSSTVISASGTLFAGLSESITPQVVYFNTESGELSFGDVATFSGGGGGGSGVQSVTNTAAVTNGSTNLVTGNDVFDFIAVQGFATDTFRTTGQRDGNSGITGSLSLTGSGGAHLTASGDISASGTGTFSHRIYIIKYNF